MSGALFVARCRLPAARPGCDTPDWWNRATGAPASRLMTSSMATKTEAYVDTSALIAFLDRSDSFHPLFRRLFSNPPRLVTSALVVAEGHGLVSAPGTTGAGHPISQLH